VQRRTKIGLAVAAALVLVLVLLVAGMLRRGFSTHEPPTAMEAWMARSFRHWSVPAHLRKRDNPVPLAPEALADARAHWADHCASCHGNDGQGQTTLGQRLYPRAPDMTLDATQDLSDGELFAIIENGVRLTGMPGWGDGTAESARESWSLVHFIRRLPHLTEEEIAEMEALNPKTLAEWEEIRLEREFLEGGPAPPAPEHGGPAPHGH
jgi:mono/diheme cytochrome c family protein